MQGQRSRRTGELLFTAASIFMLSECSGSDHTFHNPEQAGAGMGAAAGKGGSAGHGGSSSGGSGAAAGKVTSGGDAGMAEQSDAGDGNGPASGGEGGTAGGSRGGTGNGGSGDSSASGGEGGTSGSAEGGTGARGGSGANGGTAGHGGSGGAAGHGGSGQGGQPTGGAGAGGAATGGAGNGSGGAGAGGTAAGSGGSGGTGNVSPYPVQIAIGSLTLCALISDGHIDCWGQNVLLADEDFETSVTPVQVPDISTAIQISAGASTFCAVLADHSMKCWGSDDQGQISANGTTSDGYGTPTQISGITGVTEAFTNDFQTCALLTNKTVRCWGASDSNATTFSPITTISSVTNALQLGGHGDGDQDVCATSNNAAKCWPGVTVAPTTIAGLPSDITQVAGNCALSSDGSVRCWGPGGKGQIGNGSTDDQTTPQQVQQLGAATLIVAGSDHVCAVLTDQSMWCWGQDGFFDAVDYGAYPLELDAGPVVSAAANWDNTCLIEADHTVKCWGSNLSGTPLGPNGATLSSGNSATPIVIPNLPGEP